MPIESGAVAVALLAFNLDGTKILKTTVDKPLAVGWNGLKGQSPPAEAGTGQPIVRWHNFKVYEALDEQRSRAAAAGGR